MKLQLSILLLDCNTHTCK